MVAYLLLGIALIVGLVLILRWFASTDPKVVFRALKWVALGAVGVLALVLAASGRLAWTVATIFALLPWVFPLLRARRAAKAYARMAGLGGGQTTTVETRFLRMSLDHDSGTLDGEVLEGACLGRRLSDLALSELLALLAVCRRADAQSARVLEGYLDRAHPDWRRREESAGSGQEGEPAAGDGPMSREEAYAVLGLKPGASDSEIRAAHRRLIAGLHPDKGGSDYLAAKINRARQVLLGR